MQALALAVSGIAVIAIAITALAYFDSRTQINPGPDDDTHPEA